MDSNAYTDLRPQHHFSPRTGWINDPNGLVFADGKYHIFAQHYPDDIVWGPMHWYHAYSTDLLHWVHQPVALSPDELGYIFSGSAVLDSRNSSRLGTGTLPPMVALYTAHGEHEQQCLAWSDDHIRFTKYSRNPVIPNSTMRDFRDPKIFLHPNGGWGLVIAAGDRVFFYHSVDLINWRKTGEFGPEGNLSEGIWECPDLFPLEFEGMTVWVLLVSMSAVHSNHGSRTQYFLGSFNGNCFICDQPFDRPEFIDMGYDDYAAVTFNGLSRPVMIGWAANHVYAMGFPAKDYRCNFTIPKELSLISTPLGGLRLSAKPAADPYLPEEPFSGRLPSDVFRIRAVGSGPATVCLFNQDGETLKFGVNEKNEIWLDRRNAGISGFSTDFSSDWYSEMKAVRLFDGSWELTLCFDRSIAELFADSGSRVFTAMVFPHTPYSSIKTEGNVSLAVSGV